MLVESQFQQSTLIHQETIKSLWSPPLVLENFVSEQEIEFLKGLRDKKAEERSIYGKVADAFFVNPNWEQVSQLLGERLRAAIGDFVVMEGNFFSTRHPFTVHADTGRNPQAILYKSVLIPLEVWPKERPTSTIFFKQRWLGLAANFYRGQTDVPECRYNDDIFEYSGVVNLNGDSPFDKDLYESHLRHVEYCTLTGLEVEQIVEWRPGIAIISDRCQLHCSDCFRDAGVELKCGLSLFTELAP